MRQYKLKKIKRIQGIHFTADSKRLLAIGGSEVRLVERALWLDLATGENVGSLEMLGECYAVDSQLRWYAIGGANGWAEEQEGIAPVQWTTLDDRIEWQTFRPEKGKKPRAFAEIAALAFDPAGRRLAVSHTDSEGWDTELTVLDRNTGGKPLEIRTHIDPAYGLLAFNASGTRLACTGGFDGDPVVEVFNTKSGAELHNFQPPNTITHSVLFLPDERIVVANGRNVYVAKECDTQFTLSGHKGQVNALALTPDARRILSASHDGVIRVWDANTGEAGPAFDWGIGPVTALAFAPDGLTAAAAGLNGKLVAWDVDF